MPSIWLMDYSINATIYIETKIKFTLIRVRIGKNKVNFGAI